MHWYLEALKKYFIFSGRARRKEYWFFVLFNAIGVVLLLNIPSAINLFGNDIYFILLKLFMLLMILPGFAVTARRLHDVGKSGWFFFIVLIPFGNIWLIVTLATAGQKGPNKYGPDPKNPEATSSSGILDENI